MQLRNPSFLDVTQEVPDDQVADWLATGWLAVSDVPTATPAPDIIEPSGNATDSKAPAGTQE